MVQWVTEHLYPVVSVTKKQWAEPDMAAGESGLWGQRGLHSVSLS